MFGGDLRFFATIRTEKPLVPAKHRRGPALQVSTEASTECSGGKQECPYIKLSGSTSITSAVAGQRVTLPMLRQGAIHVAAVRRGQALRTTSYGPMEPLDDEPVPAEEIDVVVAPGLAFDRSANRLGYGGGHYDRLLARLQPGAQAIGMAAAADGGKDQSGGER